MLSSVGLLLALLSGPAADAHTPAAPPNIVLVMTDDQGYGDFSRMGHGALETPNLDRLAAESPKVGRFYVSPVCSPTRASLMTGRWNYRTRVLDTWIGRSMLAPEEVTVAEVLRDAGYATGIFGKWHLGDCYPLRPIDQGFEEALVHRGGGLAQPSEPIENARRYTDAILLRNGEPVETEGYCTDVYFDGAFDFIDRSLEEERPFFAYVATNAPHGPYHDVPAELLAKYEALDLEAALRGHSDRIDREARVCAMVENVDQNVGRLLAHLEARGVERETLVVFLCDNGPSWGRWAGGLRDYKSSVYEGGIRTPLFVRWPGTLTPETEVESIGAHVDLMPTLMEFAGVAAPDGLALDGVSLAGALRGAEPGPRERLLYLQSHRGNVPNRGQHFAVIGPRWKLVRASGFGREENPDQPLELFDLLADPAETTDLADARPQVVAEYRAAYDAWFEDVSTTRPDNFAPPRIVLDAAAEAVTTLTQQDIRHPDAERWAELGGAWQLQSETETRRELVLLFREPRQVDAVRVQVGAEQLELQLGATGVRLVAGTIPLPAGAFALRVEPVAEGVAFPAYQVELGAPNSR